MYYESKAGKVKFIANQKCIYHRYSGIRCFNIEQSAMSLRFVIIAYISFVVFKFILIITYWNKLLRITYTQKLVLTLPQRLQCYYNIAGMLLWQYYWNDLCCYGK